MRVSSLSLWTALAAVATLTLAGCSATAPQTGSNPGASPAQSSMKDDAIAATLPSTIKGAGVIRMATDPTYPPFETVDTDGKTIIGFDPALAQAIGEVLGVKIEFVSTAFDSIIPAIQANKVDMAMSSIGDTKKREEVVDFATYYWNGTLILVNKGNPKKIKADMACGSTIGVIRGSLQQTTFLPDQAPKCEAAGLAAPTAEAFQTGPQAQLALKSHRIDGVMLDAPPLLEAAAKSPTDFETVGPLVKNPNPGGIAFPKGSELVKPVNAALNKLIQNGEYAKLLKKWNLDAINIDTSEINGAIS